MKILAALPKLIAFTDLLDICLMSMVVYLLIIWFKRSKAVFVLIGIFIVGLLYLAARELNLQLTAAVFQGFFAVILIALIVIFQEEIKHLFERVAVWSLNRGMTRQQVLHLSRREVQVLVRTTFDLAKERIGALIVLRGEDILARHINGGVDLLGELSEHILKSIFNPKSMGHDGAVIIERDRILQFGSHLPLSKDLKKLPHGSGTRHAAALGLAELTDALCLVVSEERGTISVAKDGEIEVVADPERLNLILERFYDESSPVERGADWTDFFTKNVREKLIAVALTVTLWFFFVREGRLTYKAFTIPIDYASVPVDLDVKEIRPSEVEVTLSGPRRSFYFVTKKRIKVVLNMTDLKPGFQSKNIQKSNVIYPEKLALETVVPSKVHVVLTDKTPIQ